MEKKKNNLGLYIIIFVLVLCVGIVGGIYISNVYVDKNNNINSTSNNINDKTKNSSKNNEIIDKNNNINGKNSSNNNETQKWLNNCVLSSNLIKVFGENISNNYETKIENGKANLVLKSNSSVVISENWQTYEKYGSFAEREFSVVKMQDGSIMYISYSFHEGTEGYFEDVKIYNSEKKQILNNIELNKISIYKDGIYSIENNKIKKYDLNGNLVFSKDINGELKDIQLNVAIFVYANINDVSLMFQNIDTDNVKKITTIKKGYTYDLGLYLGNHQLGANDAEHINRGGILCYSPKYGKSGHYIVLRNNNTDEKLRPPYVEGAYAYYINDDFSQIELVETISGTLCY